VYLADSADCSVYVLAPQHFRSTACMLHLLELLLWGNTKPHLEERTAGDNNR